MKIFFNLFFVLISFQWCFSQEESLKEVDSLYKEDQFYAGVTYNLLGNKPKDLSQSGFSSGFHFGFIKDMPLNLNRNIAIGIGLGYSLNSYNENLLINEASSGSYTYSLLDRSTFTKNKFSNHLIEIPVEFRWRTSTPTEYKFWRIYTGFKLGYTLISATKYKGDSGSFKHHGLNDFNKLVYGLTLSAGYNTWNIYLYYGLNPIFSNNAKLDGNTIDVNAIKIGLMFYVL